MKLTMICGCGKAMCEEGYSVGMEAMEYWCKECYLSFFVRQED